MFKSPGKIEDRRKVDGMAKRVTIRGRVRVWMRVWLKREVRLRG